MNIKYYGTHSWNQKTKTNSCNQNISHPFQIDVVTAKRVKNEEEQKLEVQ